jgi:hypothetical protein
VDAPGGEDEALSYDGDAESSVGDGEPGAKEPALSIRRCALCEVGGLKGVADGAHCMAQLRLAAWINSLRACWTRRGRRVFRWAKCRKHSRLMRISTHSCLGNTRATHHTYCYVPLHHPQAEGALTQARDGEYNVQRILRLVQVAQRHQHEQREQRCDDRSACHSLVGAGGGDVAWIRHPCTAQAERPRAQRCLLSCLARGRAPAAQLVWPSCIQSYIIRRPRLLVLLGVLYHLFMPFY